MSNYNFNYAFNISGNCNAVVAEISGEVEKLQRNLRATTSVWDSFEGKILAFNQVTQYVENLGQAMRETLALSAIIDSIKGITEFIDLLICSITTAADNLTINENNCYFTKQIDTKTYYKTITDEKLKFEEDKAIPSKTNEIYTIQHNWCNAESTNNMCKNREIFTHIRILVSNIFNKTLKNQLKYKNLLSDIKTIDIEYNKQKICNIQPSDKTKAQWQHQGNDGDKCHSQNIYPDHDLAIKSIATRYAAQSIILMDMATQKVQESILGLVDLNIIKQITNEKKEKLFNSITKSKPISTGWEICDTMRKEQSAISTSISSVCKRETIFKHSTAQRNLIQLTVEKVIDGVTINHNGSDINDESIKEHLEDIIQRSFEKLLSTEIFENVT